MHFASLSRVILALALAFGVAACASPSGETGATTPEAASAGESAGNAGTNTPPPPAPVPQTAANNIPIDAGEKPPTGDGIVRHCKVDADCAIKDVGSCCGAYPQCVNRDSPTFPEQVKAQCASEGRMSVCGFPSISGCRCVQGQCEGVNDGGADAGAVQ